MRAFVWFTLLFSALHVEMFIRFTQKQGLGHVFPIYFCVCVSNKALTPLSGYRWKTNTAF